MTNEVRRKFLFILFTRDKCYFHPYAHAQRADKTVVPIVKKNFDPLPVDKMPAIKRGRLYGTL